MSSLCSKIVDSLKEKHSFNQPLLSLLKAAHLTEDFSKERKALILSLPSSLHKERAEIKLLPLIKKELFSIINEKCEILVKISPQSGKKLTLPLPSPQKQIKTPRRELFNPLYTFKNFISGPSNSLALESLKHASFNPISNTYSPIFIYGKTGLGKTHLLHALGQNILSQHPALPLRYLSAERFLHKCVTSIRLNQMEAFQKEFRQNCQILLIDDIQSIERGLASQEEFFHTFNAITERQGLVVCSCDRLPKEIKKLETRLQTRLAGGLVIQIEPPNLETRIAILQKKSQQKKLSLSHEAFSYIAQKNPKASVRELEGCLNKIKMICDLQSQKPNLSLIQNLFSDEPFSTKPSTPEECLQQVAHQNRISSSLILSKSRAQHIVLARAQAVHLVHKHFPHFSTVQIGRFFKRSHSTILHILKRYTFNK